MVEIGVWKVYKKEGNLIPVYVHWANILDYDSRRFVNGREFGSESEAEDFIDLFWETYWSVVL